MSNALFAIVLIELDETDTSKITSLSQGHLIHGTVQVIRS